MGKFARYYLKLFSIITKEGSAFDMYSLRGWQDRNRKSLNQSASCIQKQVGLLNDRRGATS